MDLETKAQLDKILALSEENNKMLVKVRRFQRWTTITKGLYWFVILGVAFGAFYFIQPYLTQVSNLYQAGSDDLDALKSLRNSADVEKVKGLLDSLNQQNTIGK